MINNALNACQTCCELQSQAINYQKNKQSLSKICNVPLFVGQSQQIGHLAQEHRNQRAQIAGPQIVADELLAKRLNTRVQTQLFLTKECKNIYGVSFLNTLLFTYLSVGNAMWY